MKKAHFGLALAVGFALCRAASGNIIGASWDYGEGSMSCYATPNSTYTTWWVDGSQTGPSGQMNASFTTDTTTDPTLVINEMINNDSSYDWTSYVLDIFMNKNFTFSGITVANPSGWAGTVTVAPHQVAPNTQSWVGEITYYQNGGPVVNTISGDPNNILNFNYDVSFSGSTSYTLTEVVSAVPEPGVLSIVGMAVFGLGFRAFRRNQAA